MFSALNILQIVQTVDPRVGGVAPAVLELSRGMARRGHKVEVVTLDENEHAERVNSDSGIALHRLGHGASSYHYSKELVRWLRENSDGFDRVIVNGLWQHPTFAVWRQFRRSSTPYFVFPHGMLDPWFKRTFPLKHVKKWLYWPWAEYRVLRDAAAVIFTSEEERNQARESFWLYKCNERVSPLGIEPPPVSPGAKDKFFASFPQLRDRRVLLFLGRLHPKKGCDMLIEALRSHPGFSLVMAGPDQVGWATTLRAQLDEDLAGRVVFPGMIQGELKQGAFAAAEAFILPSHQENFGMSVVEALATGLPVLISNRVNIWREIEQDGAGYVENDDLAGTERLISRWSETAPAERQDMSAKARNCFARRYTLERAVDSLLAILSTAPAASPVAQPVNAR